MAKHNGRRYIGIEVNPEYCEIAEKRFSATSAVLGQGNAADKKRRRENVTITNQPKAVVFFNGLLRSRPVKP